GPSRSPKVSQGARNVRPMSAALLVVGMVVGLGAGVAAALGGGGRVRPAPPGERARAAAAHEATVRAAVDAAVDTVVKVAGERLGAEAHGGSRARGRRTAAFG